MKTFIDRIFKKRKHNVEQIEEPIKTEDKATEAMVEAIIEEVEKEIYKKPSHYFGGDCKCVKCVRWRNQNA
jgi:DNA-binding ferritin-like protein